MDENHRFEAKCTRNILDQVELEPEDPSLLVIDLLALSHEQEDITSKGTKPRAE